MQSAPDSASPCSAFTPAQGCNLPPHHVTPLGCLGRAIRLDAAQAPGLSRFTTTDHYALVLMLGSGRYRDQRGRDERLHEGDVLMLFPDLAHQFGPAAGDTWEAIYIGFSGPAFDAWRLRGLSPARPLWPARLARPWHPEFHALLQSPPASTPAACLHLARLHALLAAFLDSFAEAAAPAWLPPVCALLAEPSSHLAIPELARQAGFATPDAFRRAFTEATGFPPSEYRRRQIMTRAAHLLHDPSLTLADIAEQLEICDAFQFSRAFKQHHGVSPDAYRKRLAAKPIQRCVIPPMHAPKKPMAARVRLSGSSSNPPVFNSE